MVRYRSYKGEVGKIAPNIIDRNFTAEAPNSKWATDVTPIKIGSVKLYFFPILYMFNDEIISYDISRKPDMEQIYDMLDKAFTRFDSILHSDQVWQYQHYGNRERLEEHHIVKACLVRGAVLTTLWRRISLGL